MVQGDLLGRPASVDQAPLLDAALPAIVELNENLSAVAGW